MYDYKAIEKKWQEFWRTNKSYKSTRSPKPKFYVLDMFPYPSGKGLHVGHLKGYVASDVVTRYKRACGFEVLHPMGWDSFGLPTERQAQRENTTPQAVTKRNIAAFREQLEAVALSYDWDREIATSEPSYYRWTQWIFAQLFERGLAYTEEVTVNWCPAMGTVLANEEVVDGKYVETGDAVERRKMKQWMLKITQYADRLLDDLKLVDWPEPIKKMQENWIGRSEGAKIVFSLADDDGSIEVFTTRPDTILGVSYLVLAPEHSLIDELLGQASEEFSNYVLSARNQSDLDRLSNSNSKTGYDTGLKVIHPITKEKIPVWVSDYVVGSYGTGAVMAVPAHDDRDYDFANKFGLPLLSVVLSRRIFVINWACDNRHLFKERSQELQVSMEDLLGALIRKTELLKIEHRVTDEFLTSLVIDSDIQPDDAEVAEKALTEVDATVEEFCNVESILNPVKVFQKLNGAYTNEGYSFNSSNSVLDLDGLSTQDSAKLVVDWLTKSGNGSAHTNYKIRDWLFSRQRYWGEPFPILFDEDDKPVVVDSDALPVTLPNIEYSEITNKANEQKDGPVTPLGFANQEWLYPRVGEKVYKRETNTMPQWAGSCWYFLRFCDPSNQSELCDKDQESYWMPIDLYIGGAEHATLHLLYARFWHKFLFDLGIVSTPEPFKKLFNQGMVHSVSYRDASGKYHYPDEVVEENGEFKVLQSDIPVVAQVEKMSKSKCNGVPPEVVIADYGADALRLYEMFMGPIEDGGLWDGNGIKGTKRFLDRLWSLFLEKRTADMGMDDKLFRHTQQTIKSVTDDIESLRLNTAVSSLMILLNEASKQKCLPDEFFDVFARLLQPFAPHFSEELWNALGNQNSIMTASWPDFDPSGCQESEQAVVVQVNGKKKAVIRLPTDASQADAEYKAREEVSALTNENFVPRRIIYVPGKILNFVV